MGIGALFLGHLVREYTSLNVGICGVAKIYSILKNSYVNEVVEDVFGSGIENVNLIIKGFHKKPLHYRA